MTKNKVATFLKLKSKESIMCTICCYLTKKTKTKKNHKRIEINNVLISYFKIMNTNILKL